VTGGETGVGAASRVRRDLSAAPSRGKERLGEILRHAPDLAVAELFAGKKECVDPVKETSSPLMR
jgi:hypothetical protein